MASRHPTARLPTSITTEEVRAALLAALVGTLVVGVLLQVTSATPGVAGLGSGAGGGYPVGWLVLLAANVAFAVAFVEFLSRTIGGFVPQVIALSSQQELLQKALVPLLRRSALTVTAVSLGVGYGVLVAVAFHVLAAPAWLDLVGATSLPVPNVDLAGSLAWVACGAVLGAVYGQTMER